MSVFLSERSIASSRYGVLLLKFAVVYLFLGLGLGLFMAIGGQFDLRPVHTHANLLGWLGMGVSGLVYCVIPGLGETRLAKVHVWLHGAGLPVMLAALALYALGHTEAEPVLGVASVLTTLGLVAFGLNVWTGLSGRAA